MAQGRMSCGLQKGTTCNKWSSKDTTNKWYYNNTRATSWSTLTPPGRPPRLVKVSTERDMMDFLWASQMAPKSVGHIAHIIHCSSRSTLLPYIPYVISNL